MRINVKLGIDSHLPPHPIVVGVQSGNGAYISCLPSNVMEVGAECFAQNWRDSDAW